MNSKSKILNITVMGLMTAIICILAPLSIPIGPVPISLTMMAIYFIVYMIGGVKGTICFVLYLVIGMIGLPVFANYTAGFGVLAGPTGGYLIGFIFLAAICGGSLWLGKGKIWVYIIGMVLGIIVAYAFGSAWFMISYQVSLKYTLTVCVIPFLPFDAIKIAIIAIVGPLVKKPLRNVDGMSKIIKY